MSNKITSALRSKQEKGDYIGGVPPYGYKKSKENKNKLVVDEVTKNIIKEIFELRAKSISFTQIAKILNEKNVPSPKKYYISIGYIKKYNKYDNLVWGADTVRNIAKSEIYIGNMVQRKTYRSIYSKTTQVDKEDWVLVKDTHKPIINMKLWEKVQEVNSIISKEHRKIYYENRYPHKENIFRGIIKCGECEKNYIRKSRKLRTTGDYKYSFKCYGKERSINLECKGGIIQEEELTGAILNTINQKLTLIKKKEHNFNNEKLKIYEDKYNAILQEVKKIKMFKRNLFETYQNGIVELDEYKILYNKYNTKLDELIKEIDSNNSLLLSEKSKMLETEKILKKLNNQKCIEVLTKDILTLFIKKVLIYENKTIEIVWKFKSIFE